MGLAGYDLAVTTDENQERVAVVQRLSWAYLRTALDPKDSAWQAAREALAAEADPLGRVESKVNAHGPRRGATSTVSDVRPSRWSCPI